MSQIGAIFPGGGGGGSPVETLTGNSGGAISPDGSFNINIVGAGGTLVTGNAGTHTLTITSPAGFTWAVTTVDASMVANHGYIANKAGLLTMTLPAVAAIGDTFAITGINNATGWKIGQGAGQVIHFGTSDTTSGVGGSLASFATRDTVTLICVVANTDFQVISSVGNITVT